MSNKNVLLLGAGMVSDPLVDYFCRLGTVNVTVATRSAENGQRLLRIGPRVTLVVADVQNDIQVIEKLVEKADICVSLLPYIYHATIAKICIQKGTNMVTSSYISPELQALDAAAKSASITVMNESGLDPGIDHMLAMQCIDSVHAAGGKVNSFVSFCGGLPSPEVSDNALRYKFSWSPRGMLLALLNPAKFLLDGKVVEVEANGGVLDRLYPIRFMPGFHFVGYPNRDSTKYSEIYGLGPAECQTLLRGTLRFQGFVEAVKAIKAIGYLSTEKRDFLNAKNPQQPSWRQATAKMLNLPGNTSADQLKQALMQKLDFDGKEAGICAVEALGLLSDEPCPGKDTPLDTLAQHLAEALKYGPEERDLVVLNHDIEAAFPNGVVEQHRISLTAYGEARGYSAMARTVGYTTAIVTDRLLKGEIKQKGMLRPVASEVYGPVLKRLEEELGIKATTRIARKMPAKM